MRGAVIDHFGLYRICFSKSTSLSAFWVVSWFFFPVCLSWSASWFIICWTSVVLLWGSPQCGLERSRTLLFRVSWLCGAVEAKSELQPVVSTFELPRLISASTVGFLFSLPLCSVWWIGVLPYAAVRVRTIGSFLADEETRAEKKCLSILVFCCFSVVVNLISRKVETRFNLFWSGDVISFQYAK